MTWTVKRENMRVLGINRKKIEEKEKINVFFMLHTKTS